MPRGVKPGIKIILAKGTRVPGWVARNFFSYQLYPDKLSGKSILILELPGAAALFGGRVFLAMKTPDFYFAKAAFRTASVFEIRDLQDRLLERNWFFCERCVQNSGKRVGLETGTIA